jgi:anti-anti-sigma factor
VWAWTGELDAADAPALRSTWACLAEDQPPAVVVDLAGVTFLDCAGLSVLVRANHDARTHLLLCAVPPSVDRLLALTGLSGAFTRVPALAAPSEG